MLVLYIMHIYALPFSFSGDLFAGDTDPVHTWGSSTGCIFLRATATYTRTELRKSLLVELTGERNPFCELYFFRFFMQNMNCDILIG